MAGYEQGRKATQPLHYTTFLHSPFSVLAAKPNPHSHTPPYIIQLSHTAATTNYRTSSTAALHH